MASQGAYVRLVLFSWNWEQNLELRRKHCGPDQPGEAAGSISSCPLPVGAEKCLDPSAQGGSVDNCSCQQQPGMQAFLPPLAPPSLDKPSGMCSPKGEVVGGWALGVPSLPSLPGGQSGQLPLVLSVSGNSNFSSSSGSTQATPWPGPQFPYNSPCEVGECISIRLA